jgi:hypothetical protein
VLLRQRHHKRVFVLCIVIIVVTYDDCIIILNNKIVLKCALDMHIRYTQLRENDIVPIRCNGNKAGTSRKDILANLCVKRRHVY